MVNIHGVPGSLDANSPLQGVFSDVSTFQINVSEVYNQITGSNFDSETTWMLGSKEFKVHLIPHDIRHQDYKLQINTEEGIQELDPGPSYTYRGWNTEDPSREVRLSITPDYITGYITDVDGTEWFLQPASDFGDMSGATVLYNDNGLKHTGDHTCGSDASLNSVLNQDPSNNPNPNSRSSACMEAQVAIAADYLLYAAYNNNASTLAQHLLDIKNLMEPNYSIYNVQFKVMTTLIETSSGQNGWTSSNDPGALLDDYSCWAGSGYSYQLQCTGQNGFGVTHDVGELWTGRDFAGSTVGLAWIQAICGGVYKYSVNQHYTSSLQSLRVLIAHETGHNFGANHTSSPYIMAPSVNPNATTWASAAQNAINSSLPNFNCLGSCGSTGGGNCVSNLTITPSNATGTKEASNQITTSGSIDLTSSSMYNAPSVLLNGAFTVRSGTTFEIRSNGCAP